MAARKGRGNTVVNFNAVNLTNYCNSAELDAAIDRLETTHLGSTAAESIAGDAEWGISLEGDWDNALDAAIGPEAVAPGTKRTASIAFTGTSATVTYTWTTNAEIQNYNVKSAATGKLSWTAKLALSGAPVRTSA